jgi:hypothetical protein
MTKYESQYEPNLASRRTNSAEEAFPPSQDLIEEKVACSFTSVSNITSNFQTLLQSLHFHQ